MSEGGLRKGLWESRWRMAAWLAPALMLVAFAHKAVLPLATRVRDARDQVASLRENTYEQGWLDSTQRSLGTEVELLKAFHAHRQGALIKAGSPQATVDRIRNLAQKSGMEVVKTTPVLAKADPLNLLKVRMEGFVRYPGLLVLFDSLEARNPDLFLEEMLLRQGREGQGGRLESHLILHAYSAKETGTSGMPGPPAASTANEAPGP